MSVLNNRTKIKCGAGDSVRIITAQLVYLIKIPEVVNKVLNFRLYMNVVFWIE